MNKRILTKKRSESGFSLLVALIFVAFFGSVLTTFVYNISGDTLESEADITGWQAAKIAKAARIYVRDQIVANPNLKFNLDIDAGGPQVVSLNTLSANALMPSDIARQAGGQFFTALDQEIIVIMANFPIDGDPNEDSTVPTAYIYLKDSPRADASLIQDVVETARRQDVALSAPIFNAGANISGTCNGLGDAVAIWDTGCLGEVEFTALTGEADFVPGSLLIPAWRAVNFDTRVLMRFPQPETTGMTTMMTELEMGDPLTDCDTNTASRIAMPSDSGAVSDLCGAMSDNSAATNNADADRRRDIIGTNAIQGGSYVAYRQAGNDVVVDNAGVRTNAPADENYAFNVNQDLTATGDMKIFDGNITISDNTQIDRNAIVSTQTTGRLVSANIGNRLSGDGLSTKTLEVINTVNTGSNISATGITATPAGRVTGTMVSQQLLMNTGNSTINVNGSGFMLGDTQSDSTIITGTGDVSGYSYVSGNLNANNVQVQNDAQTGNTVLVGGTTNISQILNIRNGGGTANCAGDCPERIDFCTNQGALSFEECMSTRGW
jgi:hypothetical protein